MQFHLRKARPEDIPALQLLIRASVRGLQAGDYSAPQLEAALHSVYGVDSQLIADGTYFVGFAGGEELAGCGGWSRRRTLYGADQWSGREDTLLDPLRDAARIRAFFIHPRYARRGLGRLILETCEQAAVEAGFRRLEMGATLTGVPMYRACGYIELEKLDVPLPGGLTLPIVRMAKLIGGDCLTP